MGTPVSFYNFSEHPDCVCCVFDLPDFFGVVYATVVIILFGSVTSL